MRESVQFVANSPQGGLREFFGVIRGEARQVWLKFLAAIAGLALAFGAALFSTIERESGNFWATLILSSIALLLAVIVGVTTVPKLARRVAGARLRDAFDYDVTRVGIFYVVAVLVVGIAALNTGNNLLYMIVASMLAAILISGFASAAVLRGVELDVRIPEHVFAGQRQQGLVRLRNIKRWVPSLSIQVVASKQKSKKNAKLEAPEIFSGKVYFPVLPPGRTLGAAMELLFERRGRYQQESFGLATRFPFAFLTKTRRIPLKREIVVFPRVVAADETLDILPIISGEYEAFVRGRGYDLYRIREYLPEDSARHVDWKATAKSGSLKVREFTREDERKLRIVFDNPAPGELSDAAYERAVATAASIAWHFANQHVEVSFATQNYVTSEDVYDFLGCLALVKPRTRSENIWNMMDGPAYCVVITSRSRGSIPTRLWDSSYFIFMEGPTDAPSAASRQE